MSGTEVVLTREELYQQVWQTPMRKLAPRYGISDVGLAKICRKYDIPRPPLGHWAKVSHGKPSPQPKLPKLNDPQLATIRLTLYDRSLSQVEKKPPTPLIKLKSSDSQLHPLAIAAKQTLSQCKPDRKGLLNSPESTCLRLSVTNGSLSRALSVLSALLFHWESIGGSVAAGMPGSLFQLNGDEVSILLTEKIKWIPKPGTGGHWQRDVFFEPTGHLTLNILSGARDLRTTWNDGDSRRLDRVLGQVIVTMQQHLSRKHALRLDEECISRQEAMVKSLQARRRQIKKDEKERRDRLMLRVKEWKQAQEVRDYLTELDNRVQSRQLTPEDPEFYEQWLAWAHWYADQICPLTRTNGNSPLVEQLPCQNIALSELDVTASTRRWLDQLDLRDTNELFRHLSEVVGPNRGQRTHSELREVKRVLDGLGYPLNT